jgi:asparagine synthetase B (glutamine-hydrolysing)
VVTLSGGLDSRLVLGALIEMGASGIRTATWGRPDDYVHGDARVATRLAGTLGLEHRFFERRDDYLGIPEFTRQFGAETDVATYHIGELDVLDRMLAAGWPACLYRGDECFGWLGEVCSPEEAFGAVGIRTLNDLALGVDGLFEESALAAALSAQISFFETLHAGAAQLNPVDLKDRVYFEHRLARYLNPANDYKRSRVEVFNPLLDRHVLHLLSRVPAKWRLYKRIEERLIERRFPRLLTVPLASRASIPDATQRWRDERPLREFMLNTLRREGPLWSRLFQTNRLISLASEESNASVAVSGKLKSVAGRLLRSAGLYDRYKRRNWRPLNHAQPSRIQLLQRLLAMRLWLDLHENKLTLEI